MKIIWLFGIPGAGKTTLGLELAHRTNAVLVDGDSFRDRSSDRDFSRYGRRNNVVRIAVNAALEAALGNKDVIVACIAPYLEDRRIARVIAETIGAPLHFVHVKCPVQVAMTRDPKGLYAKAVAGLLTGLTGFDDPFEDDEADLVVETDEMDAADAVNYLIENLPL